MSTRTPGINLREKLGIAPVPALVVVGMDHALLDLSRNRLVREGTGRKVPALSAGSLKGAGRAAVAGSRQGIVEGERHE